MSFMNITQFCVVVVVVAAVVVIVFWQILLRPKKEKHKSTHLKCFAKQPIDVKVKSQIKI